ncbi:DEAD/DEAH box helicase [Actinocrinis puniceicyclus]|uniref:DEAD/DEAH box helicase n=1 Tax=Actinocrinis puniceicyclus TaxID=977794 RepID=A0A8J7WQI0_9ACTN|nr:DEAD/DEAH box helicase [Actinocrinis puniceicyclus]MBS2964082.1 DEAD/DEAH box helicase [Actinocrinis puniceicyclus]
MPVQKPASGSPAAIRSLLHRAAAAAAAARSLLEDDRRAQQAVREAYTALHSAAVRDRLRATPVEELKQIVPRLPVAKLTRAGFTDVEAILRAGIERIEQIPGVGEQAAAQAVAAAQRIAEGVEQDTRISTDLDPDDEKGAALLAALHRMQNAQSAADRAREPARTLGDQLGRLISAAGPLRGRLRRTFVGARRREDARAAVAELEQLLEAPETQRDLKRIETAARRLNARRPRPTTIRRDFEKRAAEYFGTLARIVGVREDAQAARGFIPEDLAAEIDKQHLDTRHLRVSLRGYQQFGARFALAGRRVIIGDEMGCGKTVEAVAALAHLRAEGERHFLVVCPASVLINWMREVRGHSTLRPYRLHGAHRDEMLLAWAASGGVGITTFETVRSLTLPRVRIAMLVVDEAHYVKNPHTQRSKALADWTRRIERVLFLTGTPMENQVEEFRSLVGYLQPGLVDEVDGIDAIAGSKAFRRAVAPAYLRRNQEDVLAELPEMTRVDEWEEFGPQEAAAYRQAVDEGNFMAMRRAAYAAATTQGSAKLRRLVEIVDEACDCGRKVVVFSYFRDVLDIVCAALGPRALGPLTGSMPAPRRQELVDSFAQSAAHPVLVSQIQAGGVGLNIQAASVVILCEPQVKPTLETQAIARAHRLGQVRKVQVHRLLVADSVDERMLELLETKTELFDAYARRSEIAESSPGARDLAEPVLARRVVDAERERLGLGVAG